MCDLTQTQERLSVVDFTQYIFQNKVAFMTQNTNLWYNDWIYVRSFSKLTWITLLLTYLSSAFVLIMYKMKYHITLLRLFGILLNQCKSMYLFFGYSLINNLQAFFAFTI